jgi:hypothetical protein
MTENDRARIDGCHTLTPGLVSVLKTYHAQLRESRELLAAGSLRESLHKVLAEALLTEKLEAVLQRFQDAHIETPADVASFTWAELRARIDKNNTLTTGLVGVLMTYHARLQSGH